MGNGSIAVVEIYADSIVFHLTEVRDKREIKTRKVKIFTDPSKRKRLKKMPSEVSSNYCYTEAFWIQALQFWLCFNFFRTEAGFYDYDKGNTKTNEYYEGPYIILGKESRLPYDYEKEIAKENRTLPHRTVSCYVIIPTFKFGQSAL